MNQLENQNNNNNSQSRSNNFKNNDEEEVETVIIKKKNIKKSTRKNNQIGPSSLRNSQTQNSYWQGNSLDEENDIEKKRNKILNMIKNAHVERLKNSVLLKEINNAHDEIERFSQEGDYASAKMMETELNDLHSTFLFSNLNPITKTKFGKSAYFGNPYSSFNKTQFNSFQGNLGKSMRTNEKNFYQFSQIKKSKREMQNQSEIIEEENEEERHIKRNKKGKRGNEGGNNKMSNNQDGQEFENNNIMNNNKEINDNNQNKNNNKSEIDNNQNNQNFNINDGNNSMTNDNRGQNFNNNNLPNNNNLNNINSDKNGNIQLTGNKSVNIRYVNGNNNEIIIEHQNNNNEIIDSNDILEDNNKNNKKKNKKKKNLNRPQGEERKPYDMERGTPNDSFSEKDNENEEDEEEEKRKKPGLRIKKIIENYSENEIIEDNQDNSGQINPNYPNQNNPNGNQPKSYLPQQNNNNINPNNNQILLNPKNPNSSPGPDGFPNNINSFPQNNPNFPNYQNPNMPYHNQPFENTINRNPNQRPDYPNQPEIQNINPNLMLRGVSPIQFYPKNPNNPSPYSPYYPINYPSDNPFPQRSPQYGTRPNRARAKSAKGPFLNPDIYYNYKNGPDPNYPRRPILDFGKPLSIIDKKWKKPKTKRKIPAEIYYREGRGNCFACDSGYGISRSGNSPNNYNPYLASKKVIRKDNNIYIDNGSGYYQYRSNQFNYVQT